MPTYNYPFSGGADPIQGFGDRWKIMFGGTWAFKESWGIRFTSTGGDFITGFGNFQGLTPTACFTYRNRVYVTVGGKFLFSDNNDPTGWEVQNPGAGFIPYLSEFGGQDTLAGFSQLQGRLVVAARRSVQIWSTDADPNNFSLAQTLDNIGTAFPMSLQNLGDYDVLLLDDTGVRSLRSVQITQNAVVDDVGSPIDELIQTAIATNGANPVCAIVDPQTKNYWLSLNGLIYVFSRHPSAKISAWSTFEPRDSTNVLFTPQKFVVYNGQVFCRTVQGTLITYGGANNTTYDAFSQVTFQTPWLDNKRSDIMKSFTAFEAVIEGQWTLSFATDTVTQTYTAAGTLGSAASPNSLVDSTYDTKRHRINQKGTHISMKAVSSNTSTTTPAIFSSFTVHYNSNELP